MGPESGRALGFESRELHDALQRCAAATQSARHRTDSLAGEADQVIDAFGQRNQATFAAAWSTWLGGSSELGQSLERIDRQLRAVTHELRSSIGALRATLGSRSDAFRVAMFGRTKAGKSTLHAALSREPGAEQHIGHGGDRTTRDIRSFTAAGIEFIDVPGICAYGQDGRFDEEIAESVVTPADVILFLVTNDGVQEKELNALCELRRFNKPLFLVHNLKVDLDDPLNVRRAMRGVDNLFDARTLDEHARRIRRFFDERDVPPPDQVLPIHADAAFRSTRERDRDHAQWLREYSRIESVEKALVDCATRAGVLIRARTYAEPLVRDLDLAIARLEREAFALRQQATFVEEQRSALSQVMGAAERDLIARAGQLTPLFAPIEARIEILLESSDPETLAAQWSELINGEALHRALRIHADVIAAELARTLADFQQQSLYDADAWARQLANDCEVEIPILRESGRWWRHGGTALLVVASAAAIFTGGIGGIVIEGAGFIANLLLRRFGDRVERGERERFAASKAAARQAMLESLQRKHTAVRDALESSIRGAVGANARRDTGERFSKLTMSLNAIADAVDACADSLRELLDTQNHALLTAAFKAANRTPPIITHIARVQGNVIKAFVETRPRGEDIAAAARMLGERTFLITLPTDLREMIARSLEPAEVRPEDVALTGAYTPGRWPIARVLIRDERNAAKAIGRRGINVRTASALCRARIQVQQARSHRDR